METSVNVTSEGGSETDFGLCQHIWNTKQFGKNHHCKTHHKTTPRKLLIAKLQEVQELVKLWKNLTTLSYYGHQERWIKQIFIWITEN